MNAELLGLNGAVKRVEAKTVSYSEKNGKTSERLESTSTLLFDESKNLLESSYSFPNHQSTKTIYKFDSNNRKIETQHFQDKVLQNKGEFFYDLNGREIEQKFYDFKKNQETVFKPIFTKDGFRIEEINYSEILNNGPPISDFNLSLSQGVNLCFSGIEVQKSKEIYNAKNNLVKRLFYNSQGKIIGRIFVDYNANDQPSEVAIFGSDSSFPPDNLKKWQEILFPILKNLRYFLFSLLAFIRLCLRGKFRKGIRCLIYNSPFTGKKILYDNQGRKVEVKSFLFLKEESRSLFKYDDKNNKTEELTNFHKEVNEYEYDNKNNWTKKTTSHHFFHKEIAQMMNRTVIIHRKIEYFD
ncbi:MAG: hypothetical protein K1X72_10510 [Pyrinomonadaceae bacterium]|nr:hypothetical protein [Pyrinomonadaceae bacterium]